MKQTTRLGLGTIGLVLTAAGLMVDLAAGLRILDHQVWLGMLEHLGAWLPWSAGIVLLGRAHSGRPAPQERLALLLGALLFPGLGTLGWSVASVLARLEIGRRPVGPAEESQMGLSDPTVLRTRPSGNFPAVQPAFAAPLAEARYLPQPGLRRAALEVLCREPCPRSLRLARDFLADPDPDVRALAAVAISRIEAHINDVVSSAIELTGRETQDAQPHAALGRLYVARAGRHESDNSDHRSFLALARRAFSVATLRDPSGPSHWLALAEVLFKLDDFPAALAAARSALHRDSGNSKGYLLAMEIALREHDFDLLIALARQAKATLPAGARGLSVIRWWAIQEQEAGNART